MPQCFPRAVRSVRTAASKHTVNAAAAAPKAEHAPLPYQGPIILNGQVAHSLTQERLEIIRSLDNWAEDELMKLLKPVDKCWQPSDFLPDSSDPDFEDKVLIATRQRERVAVAVMLSLIAGNLGICVKLPTPNPCAVSHMCLADSCRSTSCACARPTFPMTIWLSSLAI